MCWSPDRREQGICVALPSSALALLQQDLGEFLVWVWGNGGKATRLDLALDDFDGVLNLNTILYHLDKEKVVTRWRGYREIKGNQSIKVSDRSEVGKTVTVGSRKSSSFLRIYDKLTDYP